jgi:hypothetical protein
VALPGEIIQEGLSNIVSSYHKSAAASREAPAALSFILEFGQAFFQ